MLHEDINGFDGEFEEGDKSCSDSVPGVELGGKGSEEVQEAGED